MPAASERPGAWKKLNHPGRSPSSPFILGLRVCMDPPDSLGRGFLEFAAKTDSCRAWGLCLTDREHKGVFVHHLGERGCLLLND